MSDSFSACVRGITLIGLQAHIVDVHATVSRGAPGLHIIGLEDRRVAPTRDLLHAALSRSEHRGPMPGVMVGILPTALPKDTTVNLPIAVAVLSTAPAMPAPPRSWAFFGELDGNGHLRPVRGALPAASGAAAAGFSHIVVPAANAAEAALAGNITVLGATTLAQVTTWLREGALAKATAVASAPLRPDHHLDLQDVIAPAHARQVVEVAAAEHHHLSIMGAPAAGGTRLAAGLAGLLPGLGGQQARQVTSLYSIAGRHDPTAPLMIRPPLQSPSPRTSWPMMSGSAEYRRPVPGVVSLAHEGVLLLEGVTEFAVEVLNGLHEVLATQAVAISAGGRTAQFPARFLLAMTASPCRCALHFTSCTCSPEQRALYRSRIDGPILNRVPLHLDLPVPEPDEILEYAAGAEPSAVVAQRVGAARSRARHRLARTPWRTNNDVSRNDLYRWFPPTDGAMEDLQDDLRKGFLTPITADHTVRVAWTLADLADIDRPGPAQIDAALRMTSTPLCG
ncbi:YifB family Mg chelatase-like AAA ATPase [Actinoallomurus acanthiterrae]